MVLLSAFLTRLMPHVKGCPEPLAQQALVDAAIEFCETTQLIQETLTPIDVTAGVGSYDLTPESRSEISRVVRVTYDGYRLGALATLDGVYQLEYTAKPVYFYTDVVDEQMVLQLYPAPDETKTDALSVRAAVRPRRDATSLPTLLYERWVDAMVDGALARLYGTADQLFTDEAKAVVCAQKFRHKMTVARIEAARGQSVNNLTVVQRPFA